MQKREIDSKLLASFIEYAVANKVSTLEWNRFIVNHYHDPKMEQARRECARILGGHTEDEVVTKEHETYLYGLANELRGAT